MSAPIKTDCRHHRKIWPPSKQPLNKLSLQHKHIHPNIWFFLKPGPIPAPGQPGPGSTRRAGPGFKTMAKGHKNGQPTKQLTSWKTKHNLKKLFQEFSVPCILHTHRWLSREMTCQLSVTVDYSSWSKAENVHRPGKIGCFYITSTTAKTTTTKQRQR